MFRKRQPTWCSVHNKENCIQYLNNLITIIRHAYRVQCGSLAGVATQHTTNQTLARIRDVRRNLTREY